MVVYMGRKSILLGLIITSLSPFHQEPSKRAAICRTARLGPTTHGTVVVCLPAGARRTLERRPPDRTLAAARLVGDRCRKGKQHYSS